MAREIETRAVTLVDLPTIRRLGHQATVLHSALEYTQTLNTPNTVTLTNLLLPNRRVHTMLSRIDDQQVVGQFRLRGSEHNAHIIYIAPSLDNATDNTAWLHILDGMAHEAGQHEAHALIAEVKEESPLFETMRTAGFAVYSRRQIWQRQPGEIPLPVDLATEITPETDADLPGIQSLMAQIIPALMQSFVMPDDEMKGWVYRRRGQVMAYISATSGNLGIYLMPYVHPDVMNDANAIIASLLRQIPKADALPVSVSVSRHLDWVGTSLEKLGFQAGSRYAVMVRHITAGIRQAGFKPIPATNGAVVGSAKPPTLFHRWSFFGLRFRSGVKRLKHRLWKDISLTI
jgi:hypothetical protein